MFFFSVLSPSSRSSYLLVQPICSSHLLPFSLARLRSTILPSLRLLPSSSLSLPALVPPTDLAALSSRLPLLIAPPSLSSRLTLSLLVDSTRPAAPSCPPFLQLDPTSLEVSPSSRLIQFRLHFRFTPASLSLQLRFDPLPAPPDLLSSIPLSFDLLPFFPIFLFGLELLFVLEILFWFSFPLVLLHSDRSHWSSNLRRVRVAAGRAADWGAGCSHFFVSVSSLRPLLPACCELRGGGCELQQGSSAAGAAGDLRGCCKLLFN